MKGSKGDQEGTQDCRGFDGSGGPGGNCRSVEGSGGVCISLDWSREVCIGLEWSKWVKRGLKGV